ncbi:hypothetical protein C2E23DRAFT_888203 [Lenzites betulinus]|nr:hypothetical protein C2E23DRAFT_888203 [Lenzites betulinus]
MSCSASSSCSFSSSTASSHSAALCAWPPQPLHMSTVNTASTRPPAAQRHLSPSAAVPTIASLPSLAHSLSTFPTMTVVTNDMVHYGMLCRTKGESEAKLNSALRKTKQRQDAGPGVMMPASSARARYPTPDDDEPVLLIVPKRSKGKHSS